MFADVSSIRKMELFVSHIWQLLNTLFPLLIVIDLEKYLSVQFRKNRNWIRMFYIVFIFISSIFTNSPRQGNSFIDWNPKRKLAWSDFKAPPDNAVKAAALTSTNIKIDAGFENNSFQYHIHCMFDKSKSWGRVKNDYVLQHEQGHFDIAEIYARKLNKMLKSYKPHDSDPSKDVTKIYQNVMQGYNEEQNLYDQETNFSIDHTKQEEWLRKIDNGLRELQDYAHYN
ncbi:MAG: hypothetical protein C5B59_20760 [Bacteroidetes bacterium]|nr:MAG: hypothetical protein C5B59_20760 [Bacteroidota bacterium]